MIVLSSSSRAMPTHEARVAKGMKARRSKEWLQVDHLHLGGRLTKAEMSLRPIFWYEAKVGAR